ncbi:MAG: hypothetical protein PHH04_03810 [Thomasclavelia sp.]|nr:hypothetical protein [Thomasclavelia sp.]
MSICNCNKRNGMEINTKKEFEDLKTYFTQQLCDGIFEDIQIVSPYYVGINEKQQKIEWYADKWYKCKCCGCLWEFIYPDFPAKGFVRKFEDGVYHQMET